MSLYDDIVVKTDSETSSTTQATVWKNSGIKLLQDHHLQMKKRESQKVCPKTSD